MSSYDDILNLTSFSTLGKGILDRVFGSNYLEQQAADVAYDRQLQLNEQDRRWQEAMMDKQNLYNSPSAQMQRFRDAGLNPSMMYGVSPVQSAGVSSVGGSAPMASGGRGQLSLNEILEGMMVKAQIKNINADTHEKESKARYQDYLNQVEAQLADLPLRSVMRTLDDGTIQVDTEHGNLRVEMARSEYNKLGLDIERLNTQVNELLYNLAVLAGGLYDRSLVSPEETPNYSSHVEALKGDNKVRKLSAELSELDLEAAQAEKAGKVEYEKWLEKNKDNELVKLLLLLQGISQSFGLTLPNVRYSSGQKGSIRQRSVVFGD